MGRGRYSVGEIFEQKVSLYHLGLIFLVIVKLLVKHSYKTVSVVQDKVSHFGLGVAEFDDYVLDYLFVQFFLHPVVYWSAKQFLVRVVLGIVTAAVLYTHEVVDNVEIVVYHVATRHDVLVVESARRRILQRLRVA